MKKHLLMTLLIALTFCVNVFSQDRKVSGKVTSAEDGSGLPGVTVRVKNTNQGSQTDASGNYSISVPNGDAKLQFSFIGMTSEEVSVGSQSVVNVKMGTDIRQLSEIVVTGVGVATNKAKLAFAVESISSKSLPQAPTASIDQALVGKIAGAQITSSNGTPGAATNIVLRGINTINRGTTPMIMIDGIQVASTDLNSIDLSVIDRIEVVQGAASATIYGAQGANGVIQLFTKKGKNGQLNIDFSSSVSQNSYLNIGGVRKAQLHAFGTDANNNVLSAGAGNPILAQDPVTGLYNGNVIYNPLDVNSTTSKAYNANLKYYDHYNFFFVPASTVNNSISISGGKEKFDFAFSLSNNYQGSNVTDNGDFKRTNLTANIGAEIAPKLKFRSITQLVYTKNTIKSNDRNILYSINNTRPFANYEQTLTNGDYAAYVGDAAGVNGFNPKFYQQYLNHNGNKVDVIQNLNLNYELNKFVELDAKYGINYQRDEDIYTYANQTTNPNIAALPSNYYLSNYGSDKKGEIDNFGITKNAQNFLATATIRTDFMKDFNLSLPITTSTQLAFDWRKQTNDQYVTYVLGLPTYTPYTPAQGTSSFVRPLSFSGTTGAPQGTYTEPFLTYGYVVNQRIEYGEIAGVSGGFRSDYSSAFGGGSKPFTFPRGDAYVRLSSLDFWKSSAIANTLSEFKLRAAYGEAGIQPRPFDRYVTLGTRNIGSTGAFLFPTAQANPDLNVEVSKELEIGTDLSLNLSKNVNVLNDIRLSATYWKRNTEGAIWNVDAAPSTGAGTVKTNAFGIGSNGIQAQISAMALKGKDFTWNTTINFSKQTSEITSVSGNGEIVIISSAGSTNYVLKAGEKIGQLYGFKYLTDLNWKKPNGTLEIPENQQSLYEVASNGYVVNKATKQPYFTADRYSFGDPNPAFNMSFINDFTYKGYLNVGFQVDWVQGSHIYNQTKQWMYRDGIHADYEKELTVNGQTGAWTAFYRGVYAQRQANGTKDYFYEDASFVRLRNISIGIDLAKAFNIKAFKKLQLVLSGRNLLTFTKYTGFDPEVSSGTNNSAWDRGTDHNTMPNLRSYQVGLNFGF
ncbi:TonB-linked SusC/RagA family outer membrane protein [Arcicella aurantiaca]|uniref:TonB-linked SusC/RagA family outer membrane protein n=1 Tax=Arcicella aurantiaca TaxID=591202 RepID=A0A316EFI6_9BACT|nr:SusC/RagA family TonB-linked outer membrane protein [Arcicella aurantiaca]PWK29433.1 TonB-linked SusC/RagA family outer membrane protein [Arcicella aurantiaca]